MPAYGGDLNPVPVLITRATIDIPFRFSDRVPINPKSNNSIATTWKGAQGLATDIRYFGEWILERAEERIGHLYPKVNGSTVVAWLWVRTVRSPDPSWNGYVPLFTRQVLRKSKKSQPAIWVEPVVDYVTQTINYKVREGNLPAEKRMRRCVATGAPLDLQYVRDQGCRGLIKEELMAIVVEGGRGREYLDPNGIPDISEPSWRPNNRLLGKAADSVPLYGKIKWGDLFTDRQIIALNMFSDLLLEVRNIAEQYARLSKLEDDGIRLRDGGSGVSAYVDAIITYLSFVITRCADRWSSLSVWQDVGKVRGMFGRQAIPMVWDFPEANPFSSSAGNWLGQLNWICEAVDRFGEWERGEVLQRTAVARLSEVDSPVVCTDPPYYDNIQYADISDFFYVWLRRNLSEIWPDECSTLLTPKKEELVANPWRHGSKKQGKKFFESGMAEVMNEVARVHNRNFPATIFYAFKQQETKEGAITSTGWETFLQSLTDAGLQITATWPIRTEMPNRMIAIGTSSLASSVVLACRRRADNARLETRGGFIAALRGELPDVMQLLQEQAIPPVDMAQSAIGPGMRIFSRYARVVEADGSTMSVRTALGLINGILEEILSAEESELDSDSRFALTWYRQYGFNAGPFGDAEVLAKAMGVAVEGVVDAEVLESKGGKVRLLRRDELDPEWDPRTDRRLTVWEITQHLIARMEKSEREAGELLAKVGGGMSDQARHLAYLLYQVADSKGATEDAVAYNSLVTAWESISQEARHSQGPIQIAIPT